MQRRGKTAAGTQRFFCVHCGASAVRARPDTRSRHARARFVTWLLSKASKREVARSLGCHRNSLVRRFAPFWSDPPVPEPPGDLSRSVLIMDGFNLGGRGDPALVGRTRHAPVYWIFDAAECFASWGRFCREVPAPFAAVVDGQKGMLKAIRTYWPGTKVQRCQAHVVRLALARITRNPRSEAGKELRELVLGITRVKKRHQRKRWLYRYWRWEGRHAAFLGERTAVPGPGRKWRYSHRELRAVRSLIRGALPHLFTCVDYPFVPNTTNHVEGGTNAQLAGLLWLHRGLDLAKRRVLVAHYLASKQVRKPPRNGA